VKVAETVTALLGIVKAHGVVEEPLEQDAPIMLQPTNCHPELGVAVTDTRCPTASEQPLGQFGLTEPEPEATFVSKV